MDSWTETASPYLADWQPWNWYATSGILLVSVALLVFAALAIATIREELLQVRWYILVPGVVLILVALGSLLYLPGTLMRHIPHHEAVWWVVAPSLLVAGALAVASAMLGTRLLYIPAAALALGVALGAIDDALKRAASSFPTSVLSLVIVALFVAFAAASWARNSR